MVGTAQVDNFGVFIKKIGYSVGVEALLRRAIDFGERYASVASFRDSDWNWLVHEKWNLKTANVGDIFAALGIAKVHNREVFPGPIGEALGITRKLLDAHEFEQACRLLVALALVDADGDIFLNALRSRFDKRDTAKALVSMVREKRFALFELFKSTRDREAVAGAVSIERQRTNKGGGSPGGLSSISRGVPLQERVQGLGLPQRTDINLIDAPSPDYLHKITLSRRGWSESLGLFRGEDLTDAGLLFLSTASQSGLSCRDGTYCVWPTKFEVEANQFDARGLSELNLLTTWQFQEIVFRALGGTVSTSSPVANDIDELARDIVAIYQAYRDLSQHRNMIRNEVSSHIVTSVLLARAYVTKRTTKNIEAMLRSPLLAEHGITVRESRTIELAITVRPNASQAAH
jgi:hypothetical protein